jgi:hypothetical protein
MVVMNGALKPNPSARKCSSRLAERDFDAACARLDNISHGTRDDDGKDNTATP